MVIIDAPFVSEPLLEWLVESQHPVLGNAFATALEGERALGLNLVDDADAAARVNAGERVYTNTENALEWLLESTDNEPMKETIRLFKDKAAMRERLAGLDPALFFATYDRDELAKVDAASLPLPVVLKPAVGFCSMGVYVIEDAQGWQRALEDIERCEAQWRERYPQSVVGGETYLVESYLTGQEYAVDAYYDEQGKAHVLNVLRHDFASVEDTSDRMYLTSASIVGEMAAPLEAWLDAVNDVVGARSFPVHVEVRAETDEAGGMRIAPIEFNPLRFAGLGGTDVALYGMGLRTYQAYLEDTPVDLPQLFESRGQDTFVMSLLNPAPGADLSLPFDYDAFEARFTDVLSLHRFDPNVTGSYGFLFLRTDPSTAGELNYLLHTDLTEFASSRVDLQAILFDGDGTLIDTEDIILASMRHTVNELHGLGATDEELMAGVGTPLPAQMLHFAGGDEALTDVLVREYRAHNDAIHDAAIHAFPDTRQALELLRDAGFRMGVVTSKRHEMAARGLELSGIGEFFEVLVAPDDWPEHKPAPGPILYACRLMGVDPKASMYVGDSPYDIQAGNAAGCTTVAALWGMFSTEVLRAEHPDRECASLLDLAHQLVSANSIA